MYRTKIHISMKHLNRWLLMGLLTLLPACTFHAAPVSTLPAVGPAPHMAVNDPKGGYLMVYSAWELFHFQNSRFDRHSDYNLLSPEGKLIQKVQNYNDRYDENPVRVQLAPGSYTVSARSARSGRVTVPVIIKDGETTCVYLDGSNQPQSSSGGDTLVKLPNGQAVGWAAKEQKENSVVASSQSEKEKTK
jgi:hypothetical protein